MNFSWTPYMQYLWMHFPYMQLGPFMQQVPMQQVPMQPSPFMPQIPMQPGPFMPQVPMQPGPFMPQVPMQPLMPQVPMQPLMPQVPMQPLMQQVPMQQGYQITSGYSAPTVPNRDVVVPVVLDTSEVVALDTSTSNAAKPKWPPCKNGLMCSGYFKKDPCHFTHPPGWIPPSLRGVLYFLEED